MRNTILDTKGIETSLLRSSAVVMAEAGGRGVLHLVDYRELIRLGTGPGGQSGLRFC
jgi:hypothetical protein